MSFACMPVCPLAGLPCRVHSMHHKWIAYGAMLLVRRAHPTMLTGLALNRPTGIRADGLADSDKTKNPEPLSGSGLENFSAATYSPTQLPVQYHRR
jgi:hypothetical protein